MRLWLRMDWRCFDISTAPEYNAFLDEWNQCKLISVSDDHTVYVMEGTLSPWPWLEVLGEA